MAGVAQGLLLMKIYNMWLKRKVGIINLGA